MTYSKPQPNPSILRDDLNKRIEKHPNWLKFDGDPKCKGRQMDAERICETAERWVLTIPGLRDYGIATLAFWGRKI